jgi:hypothetical protein
VDPGLVTIRGRAWGGTSPIARVEVRVDGEWSDAALQPPIGRFAWRGWAFDWNAEPGEHELACRATDSDGTVQPIEMPWNYGGMGNNGVQIVRVTVRRATA